jgi:hypothetical protein
MDAFMTAEFSASDIALWSSHFQLLPVLNSDINASVWSWRRILIWVNLCNTDPTEATGDLVK